MKIEQMTEEQVRKAYSGFIPDSVRAKMNANRAPTPAEIEAARALLEKAGALEKSPAKSRKE